MEKKSLSNREYVAELLATHCLKQKEAVALIARETAHKLSLRTFEAWMTEPGLTSARPMPDWAVVGLERALGLRK